MENTKQVIIVAGPTSVGKTELSLILAERINGEIISADSRQLYKEMDIGTDKPSEKIRNRVKHYMIDIVDPDETYNAGRYSRESREIIEKIFSKGKYPIVVGGAGLYIRALIDGIFPEIKKDYNVKKRLRDKIKHEGTEKLYRYLEEIDGESASRLSPNDSQRIVRAVEVFEVTGKPISEYLDIECTPLKHNLLFIGLNRDRAELYERIERRVDSMFERGFVDEVIKLRDKGYHRDLDSMRAVGYREIYMYLDEEITLDEAIRIIKQKSRNYAKRQLTWFNKDKRIKWFDFSKNGKNQNIVESIIKITDKHF